MSLDTRANTSGYVNFYNTQSVLDAGQKVIKRMSVLGYGVPRGANVTPKFGFDEYGVIVDNEKAWTEKIDQYLLINNVTSNNAIRIEQIDFRLNEIKRIATNVLNFYKGLIASETEWNNTVNSYVALFNVFGVAVSGGGGTGNNTQNGINESLIKGGNFFVKTYDLFSSDEYKLMQNDTASKQRITIGLDLLNQEVNGLLLLKNKLSGYYQQFANLDANGNTITPIDTTTTQNPRSANNTSYTWVFLILLIVFIIAKKRQKKNAK